MCASASAPALYALPVEAASEDRSPPLEFCREGGFLGIGWGVASEPLDWQSYQRRAIARDGVVHPAVRELHDLPDGTLIWTRDPADGVFYLAMVNGPWRYLHTQAADDCDVHNVRPVRMVACESPSRVPAAMVNRFTGGWAIQRIHDEHAARWSASVFAELTANRGENRPTLDDVLTSYLDDRDVRNLVRAYLQRRLGYLVRPPARRPGLAGWNPVLRDGHGCEAIVRARRGWSRVARDASSLPTGIDRVFVFSPTGSYGPDPAANVTELDYDDMIEFMGSERSSLPDSVAHWVSHALDEDAPPRTD
jgi:hypothetical protein